MFNVIRDPWIKTDNGMYGIRDLLEKSPDLNEIRGENYLNEFAIYRFLFAFLMDALQVEHIVARDRILYSGKFDMDKIDAYIDKCISEGVSFDIYDDQKPFLQDSGQFDEKNDLKSIARLDFLKPTGRNKRFFDKTYENAVTMTDDEIARFLPTMTLHPSEGGGGVYPQCISGVPLYVLVKGRNLFETLALGIIPISEAGRPYGKPSWRMGSVIGTTTKAAPFVEPGLLFGLTLPIRPVRIIDHSSLYHRGAFYYNAPSWRDPYVPYRMSKSGKVTSMRAKKGFYAHWTDLITLSNTVNEDPVSTKIVGLAAGYLKSNKIPLTVITYNMLKPGSMQPRYSDIRKGDFVLPVEMIGNKDAIDKLRTYATYLDKVADILSKKLYTVFKEYGLSVKDNAMQKFHVECDKEFYRCCMKENIEYVDWIDLLRNLAVSVFDEFVMNRLGTEALVVAMRKRYDLIVSVEKLKPRSK